MTWIDFLKYKFSKRLPVPAVRHKHWRKVRKKYLENNGYCAACGRWENLEVHHIIPFWIAPELELDPSNLMTLCMKGKYGVKCHQLFGHNGNWRNINMQCKVDVSYWREKINTSKKI